MRKVFILNIECFKELFHVMPLNWNSYFSSYKHIKPLIIYQREYEVDWYVAQDWDSELPAQM